METVNTGARRLLALVLLTLALILLAARPAAAADLVSVTGDARRTLVGSTGAVVFPVATTDAGRTARPQIRVVRVTRGSVALPTAGITPALDVAAGELTLRVGDDAPLQPVGDYAVVVELSAGMNRQTVTLTVVRPTAVIRTGGTVEVVQVTGGWLSGLPLPWDDSSSPDLSLVVDLTGGSLTTLTARQTENSRGQVTLTESRGPDARPLHSSTVAGTPGATVSLGYQLRDFPLGTTTRTVELSSPQLAAPVTVTFEVTRHASDWWIPIITAVGLLIGALLRTVLAQAITRIRLDRDRTDLEQAVAGLKSEYEDDDFDAELARIAATLPTANRTTLDNQRTTVDAALAKAEARLDNVRRASRARSDAIAGSWILPADLRDCLGRAVALLQTTEEALARHDLTTAKASDTDAAGLLDDLGQLALAWRNGYASAIDSARDAVAIADGPAVVEFRRVLGTLSDSSTPLTDVTGRLRAVHRSYLGWSELRQATAAVVLAYESGQPGAADAVRATLMTTDPRAALQAMSGPMADLVTPPGPAAPPAAPGGRPGDDLTQEGQLTATGGEDGAVIIIPSYPVSLPEARRFAATRSRLARRSTAVSASWFVLLVLVASAVAYLIGADSWFGTRAQVATAFGWGFGLDLSTAAVAGMFGAAGAAPPTYAKTAS